MRKRASDPVEVYFLTDPLCPWSWAMEPALSPLRDTADIRFASVMVGWLPSPAVKPATEARSEWAAAAETGARIDPTYWDRVAPATSLVAAAAVKAAEFQGDGKGEGYLLAARRAAFERGQDLTSLDVLLTLAQEAGLKPQLFRVDIGVGRYTRDDVVSAIEPGRPASECVGWFGRRRMLRAWTALAEDLATAERLGLACPSLRAVRGKKESVVRGFATRRQIEDAVQAVR